MTTLPSGQPVPAILERQYPYKFELPHTKGGASTFHFATFAEAFETARKNGRPGIWYTDRGGRVHACENVAGQEGRRD